MRLNHQVQDIYKEKGSRFISYIFPVHSLEDVKVKLEHVKKIEYSSSHQCYAFVLNPDKSSQKLMMMVNPLLQLENLFWVKYYQMI